MDTAVCTAYAALMVLSGVGSVLGNLALLLLVVVDRELRTADTLGLTLSCSLSDLALGLSTIPFGVHNSLSHCAAAASSEPRRLPSEGPLCQGSGFVFVLLQTSSVHSLTWATVDKFTEIRWALRYRSVCTARRRRLVLALVWLYCPLNAALPLMGFGSYAYSATRFMCAPSFLGPSGRGFNVLFVAVGMAAPILTMCCLYGYIVYVARKQARRGTFVCNDQHCFYVPANNYFKSSLVMVATAVCLLVCWLPYITVCFYETFTGRESPAAASAFSTWLVLSTAALNPWVSSMTQARYRSALRRSLSKLRQVMWCSGKPSESRPQSNTLPLSMSSDTPKTSTTPRPSIPPPPAQASSTPQSENTPNESLSAAPVVSKQIPNVSTQSSSSSPGIKPSPSSSSPPPPWNNPESPSSSSTPTTGSKPTSSSPSTQSLSPFSSSPPTPETKVTPSQTSPPMGIKQEGKPIESIELTQSGTLSSSSSSSSSSSPIKDTGSRTESSEDYRPSQGFKDPVQ